MTLTTYKMIPFKTKQFVFPIMSQITTSLLESYRCAKKTAQLRNLMHLNFHKNRLSNFMALESKDYLEMYMEKSQAIFSLSLVLNIKLGKNSMELQKNPQEFNLFKLQKIYSKAKTFL